ncbi:YczE/YyaS/YitT family protein [Amycolatopsis sp. cmx-4-61]|uniref:YczE/YyaS/YitT family protein n=1 Tax=Amycolatopsis sp. cmx-4-61 TaxID=2790937 RepID=UPI00397CBBA1
MVGHAWRLPWARVALLGAGTLSMGVGIALLVSSRLGMVPMDSLHLAVAHTLGWTLGSGILLCQTILLATFVPLRLRPGLGTVFGLVVPAVTADAVLAALPPLTNIIVRLIVFAGGAGLFCAGVATYLAAALGPLPRDGLMLALAGDRSATGRNGRRLALARIGIDVVFVGTATLILGPADAARTGIASAGTAVLAVASGPLIALSLRYVTRIRGVGGPGSPRRHRPPMTLARHMQRLAYIGFQHAQGSQALQVHFVQAYIRILAENNVPQVPQTREELAARAARLRPPPGHLDVGDDQLVRAQFMFWAHNTWDIAAAVYHANPGLLPDRATLDERAANLGGHADMTSFSDGEMTALAEAFATYRSTPGSQLSAAQVIDLHLVPVLIEVELAFQGTSDRFRQRPRTDGGDVHESRLLTHCHTALLRHRQGRARVTDQIYHRICHRLDSLAAAQPGTDPVAARYAELIAAYNRNHPAVQAVRLHVPLTEFPATTTSGEQR